MGNDKLNVKKFLATICAAGLLMTGCGSDGGEVKDDSQEKITKIGMITHLNAGEKQMEEYLFKVQEKNRAKVLNHVPVFFDNLSAMEMGLEAGKVDKISTYNCVANYLIDKNNNLEFSNDSWISGLEDNFCFAVKDDDAQLDADLEKFLAEMKSDGSLNKLISEYIINVDKKNPPAIEIPKFDGADTIKIGVTGDLPPLDYINADGKPAGFNTALLSEVAKRLHKNVELVQIDSGARAAALSAGEIDVIFWVVVPEGEFFPKNIDTPDGIELSEPYFKDGISHIQLKK